LKVESRFLVGVAAFFTAVAILYWFTSYEDAGSVMLVFSALLGFLPGTYLLWWSRRMTPRPEDRDEATIAEGEGNIGAFPDNSIWPLVLGGGIASIALALVFGVWSAVLGGALVVSAVMGVVLESRRGGVV
jgi:cytochrome c oxidase subunit IV